MTPTRAAPQAAAIQPVRVSHPRRPAHWTDSRRGSTTPLLNAKFTRLAVDFDINSVPNVVSLSRVVISRHIMMALSGQSAGQQSPLETCRTEAQSEPKR